MQVVAVLLQVGLPLLEEVFVNLVQGRILVVRKGVGPLEDISALDDGVAAVLQELELLGRIVLQLVQLLHLALDDWQEIDGELAGAVVVGEPLVVPHVALELGLGENSLLLLLLETRVLALFFVEIALIVAAGGRAVLLPIAHAGPAELVAALGARHVVTSLVFLDVFLTFRARLAVGGDPVDVFGLSAGLHHPGFGHAAVAGLVR